MAEPWLSVVGIGEDGMAGLSDAARAAVNAAEVVAGGARHLGLVDTSGRETLVWPVPFAEGIPRVLALKPRRVAVLVSGDPFWFGAGATLAAHVPPEEMAVFPAPSTFSLAASRLGWRLEETVTLGLHARHLSLVRPHLAPGARLIVLLRDGAALADLAARLTGWGFGPTRLVALEALGGPRERIRTATAETADWPDAAHPVAAAVEVAAAPGAAIIPRGFGLPDTFFENDGQLTKREIRAVTLSSLAPKPGEHLWDIGAGAGSIGIEWLLAHPANRCTALERDPARLAPARRSRCGTPSASALPRALGVPHLDLRAGAAPEGLDGFAPPDAVFVGGGASESALARAWDALRPGGRLVLNAVTVETEALILAWQARVGGSLLRLSVDRAEPMGGRIGWRAAAPVLHWVAVR